MARFRYRALDARGEPIDGEMAAAAPALVVEQLRARGLLVLDAREIGPAGDTDSAVAVPGRGTFGRLDGPVLAEVAFQLSILLDAGMPVDAALEQAVGTRARGGERVALQRVLDAVRAGASLSDAFAAHAVSGERFVISLLRAGEVGGTLAAALQRAAEYYERRRAFRETLLAALLYPSLIVLLAAASILLLLIYVIPQFVTLFEDAGETLPPLTAAVFAVAAGCRAYGLPGLVVVAVGGLALHRVLQAPRVRERVDALALASPGLGAFLAKVETTSFARTVAMLLGQGVPMLTALEIGRDSVGNRRFAAALTQVREDVAHGRSLSHALAAHRFVPTATVPLLRIAEQANRLPEVLVRIADMYEAQTRKTVTRALTVLEPTLIVGTGAIVGTLLVAVLLAILGMNDAVLL